MCSGIFHVLFGSLTRYMKSDKRLLVYLDAQFDQDAHDISACIQQIHDKDV
jgi:hypothetical protein